MRLQRVYKCLIFNDFFFIFVYTIGVKNASTRLVGWKSARGRGWSSHCPSPPQLRHWQECSGFLNDRFQPASRKRRSATVSGAKRPRPRPGHTPCIAAGDATGRPQSEKKKTLAFPRSARAARSDAPPRGLRRSSAGAVAGSSHASSRRPDARTRVQASDGRRVPRRGRTGTRARSWPKTPPNN